MTHVFWNKLTRHKTIDCNYWGLWENKVGADYSKLQCNNQVL